MNTNIQNSSRTKILEVKNLKVFYGAIEAVKGLSFHVDAGEIVSLIGSNGAGKTSTLRALCGTARSSGEILLNGQAIHDLPIESRISKGLAASPEGRGVFPHLSVRDNLLMGAYSRKDFKLEELNEVFEFFPRLKDRIQQMAGTLSGGEQQMLSISRALLARPKILLLDEPSLGLAPLIVAQIFEIIKKLNAQGVTILLVEQNAKQALKISHRAYVIETGHFTIEDSGENLLNNESVQRSYLGI